MPGINRKGPSGEGPMTGRRMGRCNPENKGKTGEQIPTDKDMPVNPENNVYGFGRGPGRGRGKGKGRGQGLRFRGNA